ncbi:uncharacterized protein B0T15DRAFT_508099 [Chaetomium strumarium]|uniref:Mitochondrial chaperone BCS1-like ATPase lid domain-containing protein n=1 Tax=Chaetomium strumarium TaxID=1170767 RepID=A0AAJ0H4W5_9PEZI|nr:hypothetical protein B0T15DRAFT_508099 [Chaetomium strumarium]
MMMISFTRNTVVATPASAIPDAEQIDGNRLSGKPIDSDNEKDGNAPTLPPTTEDSKEWCTISPEELASIAAEFTNRIPSNQTFSPAEIPGFLLKRKKAPRRALDEVEAWGASDFLGIRNKVLNATPHRTADQYLVGGQINKVFNPILYAKHLM